MADTYDEVHHPGRRKYDRDPSHTPVSYVQTFINIHVGGIQNVEQIIVHPGNDQPNNDNAPNSRGGHSGPGGN